MKQKFKYGGVRNTIIIRVDFNSRAGSAGQGIFLGFFL